MIEQAGVGVPMNEVDSSDFGHYFLIHEKISGEFLLIQHDDSNFFFLCTNDCDIQSLCRSFDWYIVSQDKYNERLKIGIGLAGKDRIDGEIYRVQDEETLQAWRDILHFTFLGDFVRQFFPYTNRFQGMISLDDARCFYIHEYMPVTRGVKLTTDQKKVVNLVMRWKDSQTGPLLAKVFSLAISRMPFFAELENPVIVPIPASTRERHQRRFASFCSRLSRHLKVTDGYRAVWIDKDRPQLKGAPREENRISHAAFNKSHITGRHVYLIDDVVTTGATFIQTKRELEKLGAKSVTGIFLAKTV